jgi:menaquinone-dependent protoporphyrinogen oxidase
MSRILIVYGTTDGHTAKIAHVLADTLRSCGSVVRVCDVAREHPHPRDFDGVIVAAPVRGGKYPTTVRRWVRSHADAVNPKPTAFVSACLGVLQRSPAVDAALRAIVDTFLADTGWHPTVVKPVAGALLYRHYNWFIRRVMKRIARKAGGDTDTSRDYEYTDWNELRAFAMGFDRMVSGEPGLRFEKQELLPREDRGGSASRGQRGRARVRRVA